MSRLLTQEEFEKSINENILPLEAYKGGKHRIKVKCKICGHEWSPFGRKLLEGQGCPHCNILSKTKTNEDFVNELKVINPYIEPLEEYVNSNTKMLFRCKIEGYEWRTTPAKVLSGKGCPCCAGNARRTIEEIRHILAERNITLLSTEYINIHTKIKVMCNDCGHIWEAEPNALLNVGCGCPKCYGNIKKTHEEFMQEIAHLLDRYKILSEYQGANESIKCECIKCGHIFYATPSNLLRGHGCGHCHRAYTENIAFEYLTKVGIEFEFQKEYDGLIGLGGGNLSYDFYLPNYNLLIELQGQQHYFPVDFGGRGQEYANEQFEKQQIHDSLKREYAKNNNIELFEISYLDFKNIEQILESRLLKQSAFLIA